MYNTMFYSSLIIYALIGLWAGMSKNDSPKAKAIIWLTVCDIVTYTVMKIGFIWGFLFVIAGWLSCIGGLMIGVIALHYIKKYKRTRS